MAPDGSNPFLIPPPPPGVAKPDATDEEAKAPASAPALITIPEDVANAATVITASATHRIEVPRTPAPQVAPAVTSVAPAFFPKTPGSTAAATAAWALLLPDGRSIPISRAVFIGRNPARTPDRPGAELLPLDDPNRSLSKTHALLELDAGSLWIYDLDSTNGVVVVAPGTAPVIVEPGRRAAAVAGSELRLGIYVMTVVATR